MERKSKVQKLKETPKYKEYGYQIDQIFNSCVEMFIHEGFTDDEIKLLFKHSFVEQKLKTLDVDDQIDYVLNCDYFWDFFDEKSDSATYSIETILKKYGKYNEDLVKKLEKKAKKRHYKNSFADI